MATDLVNPSKSFNPNYLKNPNFAVIQGPASGTVPNNLLVGTASTGYPGETEWILAANGGTPAYAFSAANESITLTGAGSTDYLLIVQRIESRDANKLKGKTVTFSFETSNTLLTTLTVLFLHPSVSNDAFGLIQTPTTVTIASISIPITSTLTRYSLTVALPANVSRGLEIRLQTRGQTSGTWVVSRLQLEEGSVATAFNCGDYSQELLKCQRYFYGDLPPLRGVAGGGSLAIRLAAQHKCEMFAFPILTISGTLQVIVGWQASTAILSILNNFSTKNSVEINCTTASPLERGGDACVLFNDYGGLLLVSAHIP